MQLSKDLRWLIILLSLWPLFEECWHTIVWGLEEANPSISALAATALLVVGLPPASLLIYFLSQYEGFSFFFIAVCVCVFSLCGSAYLEAQR